VRTVTASAEVRMRFTLHAVFACGLICGALDGAAQAPPSQTAAEKSPLAACGPENVNFDVSWGEVKDQTDAPESGKATLYIIEFFNLRDKGRFGRPTLKHGLDGQWIGATQGFTYLSASVDPGEHHLCARWQSHFGKLADQVSLYNFNAEAGKRYYIRAQINVVGDNDILSMDLEQVSEDEGRFLVSEAARSLSKPKH
jgi:hypothetical protein